MEWFYKFPHMDDDALRNLKKFIDESFRAFTRAYGDAIEHSLSTVLGAVELARPDAAMILAYLAAASGLGALGGGIAGASRALR